MSELRIECEAYCEVFPECEVIAHAEIYGRRGLSKELFVLVVIYRSALACDRINDIIAGVIVLHTVVTWFLTYFGCFFSLVCLPDSIYLVIPYHTYRLTYKPSLAGLVNLFLTDDVAVLVKNVLHLIVDMTDLVLVV